MQHIQRRYIALFVLSAAVPFLVLSHAPAFYSESGGEARSVLAPERPNVVIITVDALRADHLPCYGYPRNTAPNICALGNTALLFEDAYAPAPWSLPSYATLFTGTLPPRHDLTTSNVTLTPAMTPLAEALHAEGYHTAAWIDGGYLRKPWGLDRGFERYEDPSLWRGIGNTDRIVEQASQYVRNTSTPFFLFIHTMDVHAPYNPQNRTALHRWDPEYRGPFNLSDDELGDRNAYSGNISEEDLERVIASYDASIRYTDHHLNRFFTALREAGQWNNTIVIVTADHGEAFKEHSAWIGHTRALYQEYLHVPLIIRAPGVEAKRVEKNVGLVDVMPTLLQVMDVTAPINQTMQGASLYPVEGYRQRPVYSSTYGTNGEYDKHAVIAGDMKLIWTREQRLEVAQRLELYNLSTDPREQNDISQDHPDIVAALQREISAVLAADTGNEGGTVSLPPAVEDRLRDLGYLE